MVVTPCAASRSAVRGPTPGSRETDSGARKAASSPAGTTVTPAGLFMSAAILAATLIVAIPTEQLTPAPARTNACSRAPAASGSPPSTAR